jgi:hypothetical protein
MGKPDRRPALQPEPEQATPQQQSAAQASTMETIKSEFQLSVDAERARMRNIAREYGNTFVKVAPLPGDVTREQEYAAHEDTVAQIRDELAEQERVSQARPKPQGVDDATIEMIKSEMKRTRVRVR